MEIRQPYQLQTEAICIPVKMALERLRLLKEERERNDPMCIVAVFFWVPVCSIFLHLIYYLIGAL
jgi:hypothetical protein